MSNPISSLTELATVASNDILLVTDVSDLSSGANGTSKKIQKSNLVTGITVPQGGTGATTLTGLVKGNGASAMTAVTAPTGTVVGTTDTQILTNKTLTDPLIDTGAFGWPQISSTPAGTELDIVTLANTGNTGNLFIFTGNSSAGSAGYISILTGSNSNGRDGGEVDLNASGGTDGGNVDIYGSSSATASGSEILVNGGQSSAGGSIHLYGGNGGNSNADGGDIILEVGTKNGSGADGNIYLKNATNNNLLLGIGGLTALRTVTFPNADGTIVYKDTTDTLTNKTLTTPTIASFVNANHDHKSAAGGGVIVAGVTQTLDWSNVILPDANFPSIAKVVGTNWVYKTLDFDKDTQQNCYFSYKIPSDLTPASATLKIAWTASTGTGDCKWQVINRSLASNNVVDATTTPSSATDTATTTATTAGNITYTTLSLTITSWAANQFVEIELSRLAADVADTLSGNARLITAVLEVR